MGFFLESHPLTSTWTPLLPCLLDGISRLTAFRSVVWGARIQRFQDGTGSARHASIPSSRGTGQSVLIRTNSGEPVIGFALISERLHVWLAWAWTLVTRFGRARELIVLRGRGAKQFRSGMPAASRNCPVEAGNSPGAVYSCVTANIRDPVSQSVHVLQSPFVFVQYRMVSILDMFVEQVTCPGSRDSQRINVDDLGAETIMRTARQRSLSARQLQRRRQQQSPPLCQVSPSCSPRNLTSL